MCIISFSGAARLFNFFSILLRLRRAAVPAAGCFFQFEINKVLKGTRQRTRTSLFAGEQRFAFFSMRYVRVLIS